MCCRRTLPQRLRDEAYVQQAFKRPLNINVHMRQDVGHGPAPGTPSNPGGGVESDDEVFVSPSHLLGGARSKAKAKQGPHRTASAFSNEPPNEPPPAGSSAAEEETDHVSGVSMAVARRTRFKRCAVFATTYGKCYHCVSCFKLDDCNDVRWGRSKKCNA